MLESLDQQNHARQERASAPNKIKKGMYRHIDTKTDANPTQPELIFSALIGSLGRPIEFGTGGRGRFAYFLLEAGGKPPDPR